MHNNGSVSNNIKYKDICKSDNVVINVVYETTPGFFEIVNNTMVEWYDFYLLLTDFSTIVYDFEILKPFIQNNNIIVKWTNWTTYEGLVGQVYN